MTAVLQMSFIQHVNPKQDEKGDCQGLKETRCIPNLHVPRRPKQIKSK